MEDNENFGLDLEGGGGYGGCNPPPFQISKIKKKKKKFENK